jgi:hypothetical protein
MSDRTHYSDEIPGARGNYGWSVMYDLTGGYLGITQMTDDGKVKDRVLLSPKQVQEMTRFLTRQSAAV